MKKIILYLLIELVICENFVYGQKVNSNILFNNSKNCVVEITTYDKGGNERGYGTGFIIDSLGTCVTNYHVLEDAYYAEIKTFDKQVYSVFTMIYANKDLDVVKFNIIRGPKKFKYLKLNNDLISIGDDVFIIGNPEGMEYSISTGIVSSMRQNQIGNNNVSYIQTTAPISHGSSGSPILNNKGLVIGIVSFSLKNSQNLNFGVKLSSDLLKWKDENNGKTLPLNINAKELNVDQFEQDLISEDGSFTPKDDIAVFMGQDKEIIKSFFRDWQIVQNSPKLFAVAHKTLGVYNFYFNEGETLCNGYSYSLDKVHQTQKLINECLSNGYVLSNRNTSNGVSYYTKYYVITIAPSSDGHENLIMVMWNPNYHPNGTK